MRRGAFAMLLVLTLAACGGSTKLGAGHLSRYVLQKADLPASFTAFANGTQIGLDNQGTPRADPSRFGRQGGWIARYKRAGTSKTRGPLIVVSRADLFKSSSGAASDLAEYRQMFAETPGANVRTLSVPKLGDAAVGSTFTQAGLLRLRFYSIAWRYRNASASIVVEGWDGKVAPRDAIALARRQQAHLAHG
jgi:hypothetical protein